MPFYKNNEQHKYISLSCGWHYLLLVVTPSVSFKVLLKDIRLSESSPPRYKSRLIEVQRSHHSYTRRT